MGNNGTLPQRQLGRVLRRLREEAGLTLEEAAPRLDWSTSKLNRIETGCQGIDVHGVRSMLDLYDVGGDHWAEIIDLTRQARQKSWWWSTSSTPQALCIWRKRLRSRLVDRCSTGCSPRR